MAVARHASVLWHDATHLAALGLWRTNTASGAGMQPAHTSAALPNRAASDTSRLRPAAVACLLKFHELSGSSRPLATGLSVGEASWDCRRTRSRLCNAAALDAAALLPGPFHKRWLRLLRLWGQRFCCGASAMTGQHKAKTRQFLPAARPISPGPLSSTDCSSAQLRKDSWLAAKKPGCL